MGALRTIGDFWKRVAGRVAEIQAHVLLALFYFMVLGPIALAVRLGSDPLAINPGPRRGWRPIGEKKGSPPERAIRQF